ncbi:hypothetical protein [Halorussus halophilus]|uniref:hypothetical protein n=1 Tax=Halorussus halophilus TaxID=2650975 RepID=UPI00130113F8|nr:hypothetical protein [Halorussus halophilus]
MDASSSLRWAVYYVALAGVATIVGGGFVVVGMMLGLGAAVNQLLYEGAGFGTVLGTAAPGLVVALLGVFVWAVGSAAAFFTVVAEAVDEQMQERFNGEKVKSDILSVLDDRLSDVEHDIEEMRRKVSEMKREDAANEFDFGDA